MEKKKEAPVEVENRTPEERVPKESVSKMAPGADEAKTKTFVRKSRVNDGSRKSKWEDTSFMPLPEDEEGEAEDEMDLLSDARDAIVAGRLERQNEVDSAEKPDDNAQDLPTPLTMEEILEEQKNDEFCQTVAATQVGRKDSCFFEDDIAVLRRQHPREPDLVQVVLPSTLRHRVLRLAHYHLLVGHPGQTRLHRFDVE